MKKTAITQLIDKINERMSYLKYGDLSVVIEATLKVVKNDATKLLETERKNQEHAFNESRMTHPMIGFKHETFEEYYKDTYE